MAPPTAKLKYSESTRVKEIKAVLSEWLDKNNLNKKDIDLTDGRIELYRLVYICGLLSEEKENGFRGVRC